MSIPREGPSRHLSLPEPFDVEWMLHHVRTSSYGAPYRFVDPRILRRPLRLAGIPVVAEFDLTGDGSMDLRLVSLQSQAFRPRRTKAHLLEELANSTVY